MNAPLLPPVASDTLRDLHAVLEARLEQRRAGHDDQADDERPLLNLANTALDHARMTRDVATPGERLDLDVAYRRATRTAALCLALARRIRTEQARRPAAAPAAELELE